MAEFWIKGIEQDTTEKIVENVCFRNLTNIELPSDASCTNQKLHNNHAPTNALCYVSVPNLTFHLAKLSQRPNPTKTSKLFDFLAAKFQKACLLD